MHDENGTRQDGLLTIADIARHFGLPESTARYYCKRFAPFMPSVGEGRRRRYRPGALEVVEAVLDAMQMARNAAAVEARLAGRFARNVLPLSSASGYDGQPPMRGAHTPELASVPAETAGMAAIAPSRASVPVAGALLPEAALALLEQQNRTLACIADALSSLSARQDELARLVAHARGVEDELAGLRRDVGNLRILLNASEKMQQQDLDQLRTWLTRIIDEKRRAARG